MTTASFESRYLIATVCGVIFNLLFNVILIPSMGARGAAWASVIGEIMVSATCVYYVYKLKLYSISWRCLKNRVVLHLFFLWSMSVCFGEYGKEFFMVHSLFFYSMGRVYIDPMQIKEFCMHVYIFNNNKICLGFY